MKIPTTDGIQVKFFEDIYKPAVVQANLKLPFSVLNNGRAMIATETECMQYLAAYAAKHFHKLRAAFESWEFHRLENENIEIIDWGAGLATATCTLIDYLIEKNISTNVTSITLIEPSPTALEKVGSLFTKCLKLTLENCKLELVSKVIDAVTTGDFQSENDSIKIHLFSNIVDMNVFDLNKLYNLITNSFRAFNIVIIVSPFQSGRIDRLCQLFSNSHNFIKSFDSHQAVTGEIYSIARQRYQLEEIPRYERQFAVNIMQV